jgi:DNA polymerase III epsilon subunit-like protein
MDEHLLRFDEDKTLVFIDLETFNLCLSFVHNLPWQVAMIKIKGKKKIAEKNFFIKWDTDLKIGSEAARITNYNPKVIKEKGLSPEEIFPTMQSWLDEADHILGHNIIGFDIFLIKDYYQYMGKDWKHLLPKLIDTNALAKGIKNGIFYDGKESLVEYQYRMNHKRTKGIKTNLDALSKDFDIFVDKTKRHDALYDLDLNVKVWDKLKWQIEI